VSCPSWPSVDPDLAAHLERLHDLSDGLDHPDCWPSESLAVLSTADVLGWTIPQQYGGGEVPAVDLVKGYLQLARACLPTTFVLTQRNAATSRLAQCGNEALKDELLPRLVSDAEFATVGISHLTTSRQHVSKPAVSVALHADDMQLDGIVPWVTGAGQADWVLTGGTCADGRQVLVALPVASRGVTVLEAQALLALDSSQTASIRLDGVRVSRERLVAGPVEGVMQTGGRGGTGSLGTSALALGAAAASLDRLSVEASRRPDLAGIVQPLVEELNLIVSDVMLAASGADEDVEDLSNEALRRRSNSLVLRASQSHLAASKGAGFTAGHPASRAVREAMFFLVWSCPQSVISANLRELAGISEGPAC